MASGVKAGKKHFRFLLILTGILSLQIPFSSHNLFAETKQWDFQSPNDYRFDSKKIQVAQGKASLVAMTPSRDAGTESFDKGVYFLNTWSARGSVELVSRNIYPAQGRELARPIGGKESGLAGLWHFDEPTGMNLLDEVARNVAKASDAETVSGQTGFSFARAFDGNKSYVFVPNYSELTLNGPFTVEAWIRPNTAVNPKSQTIISRWQVVGSQKSFALQISTEGKLEFLVSEDGATTIKHSGTTVLTPGVWAHVAAEFTGEDLRIFLNGVLDSEPMRFKGPVYAIPNPIYFGAMINTRLDEFYDGVIDEVSIFNRALTETELLNHAGNPSGIVGLWHLNERGGSIIDASGYGHTGAPQNDPQYEVEGKLGTALRFNGSNQYIETPASFTLFSQDALTLEAWIKPESLPGNEEYSTVISVGGESGEYAIAITGPQARVGAFASGLSTSEVVGSASLMPNIWQHVAATWGQGVVRVYVNGVLDGSAEYSSVKKFEKGIVRIASDAQKAALYKGSIDEAAVYRRAKNSEEIAEMAGLFPSSGIYLSSPKDAGTSSPWRGFNWGQPFAYGTETSSAEKGLLNLYHLNESDGLQNVDSKGENPLTPVNTYAVPGVFSSARWFQYRGADKMISQKSLPALSTFTVSLWFQFASAVPSAADRLFSIGDEAPSVYRGQDARMHVMMPGARSITGSKTLADTSWHHLAFVSDGRNLFLYIDGVPDGNSTVTSASAQAPLVLGNLKTTDTFQGALDEVAFFNYALGRDAIVREFLSGSLDLKFLGRSSDDQSFVNMPWKGPKGNNQIEEFPSSSTVALWHFNEKKFDAAPASLQDAGRFANHGTFYGKVTSVPSAALSGGALFNGASDYIEVPDSESLRVNGGITVSAWVYPNEVQEDGGVIADKQYEKGAPTFSSYALELTSGNRLAFRLGYPGGYHQTMTDRDGEVAVGKWNHVAATYDGKEVNLYINGQLKKTSTFDSMIVYDGGPLMIGRYASGSARFLNGALDELAIDQKALSPEEILTRFQNADPDNFFRGGQADKTDFPRARYFQYAAYLSTRFPMASPLFDWIEVQSSGFASDAPFVINNMSVSYADISSFRQKLGPANKGDITYQFSNDSTNWFYHNGRHWVIASGPTESNTAAQIEARIRDFPKEVGIGSFYFKAFLHSPKAMDPAELASVELEYLPNKLTMSAPNGGETLLVGDDQVIRWNAAGEVAKVTLEYSKDNFQKDFQLIVKDTPNLGAFTWKIPDDPSPDVRLRVMDALDPRIHDTTDLGFRIGGSFELISPNWNESWEVGSVRQIIWKTNGKIPNVRLDYSTDEFQNQIFPIIDSVRNEGHYEWKVPDHISAALKVRVADVRDPAIFDKSNDTFAITGNFSPLSPQPNDRWIVGSEQEIRWNTTGTIPAVKVEYKTAQNPEWKVIAESIVNQESMVWKVPNDISSEVKVRIADPNESKIYMESAPFAIIGGLRMLTPKGGESWSVQSRRNIAWESIGTIPAVNIEYQSAGADKAMPWTIIEKSLVNTGSYVWEIPNTISDAVIVRVTDARDPFVQAANSEPLKIIPGFQLKSPNGGDNLKIGDRAAIVWDTFGTVKQVRLEYSKDNFAADIQLIIEAASNVGQFDWKIPSDASTNARVRIVDPIHPEASDISDAPFRIYGGFNFLSPKGGDRFEVGSLAAVKWESLGEIPEVKIEYSRDGFNKDIRTVVDSYINTGNYSWTVPDDIGANFKMRISDTRDHEAFAVTPENFSIIGQFHLTEPVSGENIVAGSLSRISWKAAGTVPFVRIDYSEDNFERSFDTLAPEAPNTGSYDWAVPDRIGKQFKIRIWDPSHPETMDVMAEPSRIIGGFRLMEPNGGEILFVGESYDLSWETFGTVPRVKIEYSNDNFQHSSGEIADAYENNGRYRWLVPDTVSGNYKIRISDPSDVAANDISNTDFKIRSKFTLTSPNGGEGWNVGETRNIRWQTSGNVPEVKLEYSTNDFASSVTIADRVPNTGSYDWVVPNQVASNVKVRVSDAKDPEAFDSSDSAMRILGVITLESPSASDVWKVGERREIRWKTVGDIKSVRVEYSRDGFSSEAKAIVETMPNSGSLNWTVPDDIGPHTKIRVLDASEPATQAVTKAPFEIAPSLSMLGPNGGEVWHATEKREINWVTIGTAKEVILELSKDDFSTEPVLIDRGILNQGRYLWDIPKALGDNFKIRVCDMDNPKICDASDKAFSIRTPFEISFPRGGEAWPVNTDQEIRWNTYGRVDRVTLEYSSDEKHQIWKKLYEELPNENHYLFKVPDDLSKNVIFRISDLEDAELFAVTKEPVRFLGTLNLLEPNGGQKFAAGTMQTIAWDTIGSASNVRLEYSNDDFHQDVKLIESIYPNTGKYDWKIPADLGVTMKVRVSDASNDEAFDVSDGPFKIISGFTLMSPNGGEKWIVGTKQKITWKTEGRSENVRLEYKSFEAAAPITVAPAESTAQPAESAAGIPTNLVPTPKPEPWMVIADKIPNGGEFEWTIPNQIGKEVQVRVADVRDTDAFDLSDKAFEIRPDILVIAPNGGEVFSVALPAQIKWANIGSVGPVKIEYSKDGFQKDVRVIAENVSEETYTWVPSDDVTAQAVIRISSTRDAQVFDLSNQPFKILPSIKVIAPAGGENWTVGTEQMISWDWRGTLDLVKVEYTVNNFISTAVIADKVPNTGHYKWQIPDAVGTQIKIRVSDANHPESFAASEVPLSILPGFKVLSPNGGELWKIGEKQAIKWETAGTSSRVRIDYGVPEGAGYVWKQVAKVARNNGAFDWEIPADVSSQVKIRVADALNENAFDVSDNAFKILARFKILSPAADQKLRVNDRHQIRWETAGKIPSVKLEYQSFGRGEGDGKSQPAFEVIENLWANSGAYFWSVPDAISKKVFLRISDANEPDAFELMPGPFKIQGALKFDLTDEKRSWPIGSTQSFSWKTIGTIPEVRMEYSTDHGKTWSLIAPNAPNAGTYGWTIPDDSSLNVKLRISDAGNPEIFDESKEIITIAPEFKILTPKAGDQWLAGSEQQLTWKTTGRVSKLWLEYGDGDRWAAIAGPIADSGSFNWKVADAISSNLRIRLRDGDNPQAVTTSDVFGIHGALTLLRPNGEDVYRVGLKEVIQWQTTGTIPKVRVEAWIDQDQGENILIADDLENTGRLEWLIPDKISNDLRIRVSDVRDPMIMSASAKPFSIIGSLQMVTPRPGDVLLVGSAYAVTWTAQGTIPSVNLEYSRDDFYRETNLIASAVPNTGAAQWTVPDSISDQVKIRVSDSRDSRAFALSEKPFKIKGGMAITAPAAGEVWTVGTRKQLSWQTSGSIPAVRLEYSRDNFNKDKQVIENNLPNKGLYDWVVPDVISSTLAFRVSAVTDETVAAISDPIKIQGALKLNSPASGEILRVMSERVVTWETTGSISKVRLEYSRDDFNQDIQIIAADAPNKGQWNWIVPDMIGKDLKLRVSDASNYAVSSVSAGFEIQGAIAMTSPAQESRWAVGSTHEISWQSVGTIPFVRIEYSKDGFAQHTQSVIENLENRGKFNWTVPDDISENIQIRVSDMRDPRVSGLSLPAIKIQGQLSFQETPELTMLPVAAEQTIRWETNGSIPLVRLEYASEASDQPIWKVIAAALENKNEYLWKIPDDIADKVRLKISDARDDSVQAVSRQTYGIVGQLSLLGPAEGERWIVGSTHDLVWRSIGSIPEVKLEYSTDGFKKDIRTIADKIPNTGRYLWTVPDVISGQVTVRMQDSRDSHVMSYAPAALAIAGDFVFTQPGILETWKVGSEKKIEWQTIGSVPEVNLEYIFTQTAAGQPAAELIQKSIPNTGAHTLKVPDKIGSDIKLRISDPRDPSSGVLTPGAVKIEGDLAFTKPAGGEVFHVGEEQVFEWSSAGSIPTVALEYSADDFQTDVQIIESAFANNGRYLWKIPDYIRSSVRVRLRDTRDQQVTAISQPFKIQGSLKVQSPDRGAVWNVGSEQQIIWSSTGSVPRVTLEYSPDGFSNEVHLIAKNVEASGLAGQNESGRQTYAYRWIVPDMISDKVSIRVIDSRDASAVSLPSEFFKVRGDFSLQVPQGNETWVTGTTQILSWQTTGTIPFVKLEFSRDGFQKDRQLITEKIANQGSYSWQIPDAASDQVWVRVSDSNDAAVWQSHSAAFRIQGALKLEMPAFNEVWQVGSDRLIKWATSGTIRNVKLEYFSDPQAVGEKPVFGIIQANLANQGSYLWRVPDGLPSQIKIRISDELNPHIASEFQLPVKLLGVVYFTSPDAQANWVVGTEQNIAWRTQGVVPQVKLEYSRDQFVNDFGVIVPMIPNTSSFTWTVPDIITQNLQLRVSDVANSTVSALSRVPVKVSGRLDVLSPEAGARWEVASTEEIQWKTTGTIPQVRLDYSPDRFSNNIFPIAESVPNVGRYRWIIPDTIAGRLQLRVSDVQNVLVSGLSPDFSIQGHLRLVDPKGGEIWKVGDLAHFSWETTGTIKDVKLEYSTDDFTTARSIAGKLENKNEFTWMVPDIVSNNVKIRVSDMANPDVSSVLAQALKVQAVLKIVSPEGGESWRVGTQHPVLWETSGSVSEVSLDYSSDNFQTALPIVSNLPNQGRYTWTVPDIRADKLLVRVYAANDQSAFDVMDKPVSVGGALKLLSPAGGDVFKVNDTAEVKWETIGTIPKVRLELSKDGFVNDVQILEPSLGNSGVYNWKIPDLLYTPLQLRVSDAARPDISDQSQTPFKIAGGFNLLTPRGGEIWTVGSRQTFQWTTDGSIPEVRLEYSQNNFVNAIPIILNLKNTGTYTWDIPDLAGSEIRFKISDAADSSVFALSQYATAVEGAFALTEPRGGEVWSAGDRKAIAWKTGGTVRNINLEYSTDNFQTAESIAAGIPNSGSYLWDVPSLKAKDLKIRISSADNPKVSDTLKLGVVVQGKLSLLSPAGGEVWLSGTEHAVTWRTLGSIEKIKIDYSTDGFRTVIPVVMDLANENKFVWQIPSGVSKQAQLRVQDALDESVSAVNEKPFEIRGALTLLSPVGGEIWTVGNRYPISWQTSGTVPQVRIEYSTDGFVSDVQTIVPAMANNGVYYWELPQLSVNEAKVRVTSVNDPLVYDISREPFKVSGELSIQSPAPGEIFKVGQQIDIRWKSSPSIQNVKLEYSTDDFQTTTVISAFMTNSGFFPWSAPDKIGDNLRIRVSDAGNQLVYAFSKVPFSIRGGLELISPKGGETWLIGSRQKIAWETLGSVANVDVEYSTDSFKSSIPIVMNAPNTGSYEWQIPEIANNSGLKIRVSDSSRHSVFSESSAEVMVRGNIQMMAPKGGDRWIVGEEKIIRWQTSGFIQKVDIEYSKDDFNRDIHLVAAGHPNLGAYSWRVPNDLSDQVTLRIRSSQDASVIGKMDAPFKIDQFKIRWMVKDSKSGDLLTGLMFTDSTGKTQNAVASPAVFDYPYGIYSTVWSKPGYGEFRSTWLADKDQTFSVLLEPKTQSVEMARANFEYDAQRDLMNVTGWYEKDGLPQAAVINCEIRIYDKTNLIKTLSSSNPDSRGYFHMIWDTSSTAGDARYLAATVITAASGAVLTSPISYQLDLPVKERKAPAPPRVIASNYLKPIGNVPSSGLPALERPVLPSQPSESDEKKESAPKQIQPASAEMPKSNETAPQTPSLAGASFSAGRITAPEKALMNETISIHYTNNRDVLPVIDIYDSNKKLIVRGQPMSRGAEMGTYNYLLPIKGVAFIPGKSITVNVVDSRSGQFQTALIQIQSVGMSMGLDNSLGANTVLDILSRLDEVSRKLKSMSFKDASYGEAMKAYRTELTSLAGVLTAQNINPLVCQKVNRLSEELAGLLKQKGYDGSYLISRPLASNAAPTDIASQVKNMQQAIGSLMRLYQYSAG